MANRIYFANQQVAFKRDAGTNWVPAHGVQSVAVTTCLLYTSPSPRD